MHAVAEAWGDTLHELHPKNSYADLVLGNVIASTGPNAGKRAVWQGFPGPPGHRVMYRHLKDEPLMAFRRSVVGDQGRTRKVIYLGGMRWAETDRRRRRLDGVGGRGQVEMAVVIKVGRHNGLRRRADGVACGRRKTQQAAVFKRLKAWPTNRVPMIGSSSSSPRI